ncbi:MAG: hypothetical protein ABIF08_02375 [Nanoarchaeota archaeon]
MQTLYLFISEKNAAGVQEIKRAVWIIGDVMGKIEIVDDCLAPSRYIYMQYTGTDPYGVAKKIADSLTEFYQISGAGMCQTYFMWDDSSDPRGFYFRWWVKKSIGGRFSTMWNYIWVRGEVSKEDNQGHFTLRIHGDLRTTFEGHGPILNTLWHLYSFFFYNKVRRKYIDFCRKTALDFRNEMREHYNLEIAIEHGER